MTILKRIGGLIPLILITAHLFSAVSAQANVSYLENATVIYSSNQFVDEWLFLFVAGFAIVFFLISLFRVQFQDIIAGVATTMLLIAGLLSPRVAKIEITAVLDPRLVNTSNMTVISESRSLIHTTYHAYPEPLLIVFFGILFIISLINLIRILIMFYVVKSGEGETDD